MKWSAYWRLMRFDKPAGILLLWYPTAWALWMANQGSPPLSLLIIFTLGTVLMRAAGCIINDLADRNIDRHVNRTRLRPITSGELSLTKAFITLYILLYASFFLLRYLPSNCLYLALIALAITWIYPFCKRFLSAPQLVLGLAFSLSIPMVYVASHKSLDFQFYWLFIMNFLWITIYDTIYAMADKADDLRIGVKSAAIYLNSYDRFTIGILQTILQGLWCLWAYYNHAQAGFYFFWALAALILIYQQYLIRKRLPEACFKAFVFSMYYGLIIWLGVMWVLEAKYSVVPLEKQFVVNHRQGQHHL